MKQRLGSVVKALHARKVAKVKSSIHTAGGEAGWDTEEGQKAADFLAGFARSLRLQRVRKGGIESKKRTTEPRI